MKPTLMAVSIALTIATIWAQPTRRTVPAELLKPSGTRDARASLWHARPANRAKTDAAAQAASTPPQAPGVLQINLQDSAHSAWFVTTAPIPKGSSVDVSISLDNQSMLQLNTVQFSDDAAPGQSYALPGIGSLGDFSTDSVVTYAVLITINGNQTQAAADFTVGASRNYQDLQSVIPLITSTVTSIGGNKDVMLAIKGVFTSDPVYVVLDGIAVPAGAITASRSEIDVDLSRVPGLELTSFWDYLLTAGQGGWSDTAVYRYIPPAPGTYNPAPQP